MLKVFMAAALALGAGTLTYTAAEATPAAETDQDCCYTTDCTNHDCDNDAECAADNGQCGKGKGMGKGGKGKGSKGKGGKGGKGKGGPKGGGKKPGEGEE